MRKKKVALFLIITIIMQFTIANTTYASSPFAGGDGTEENPYQVSTPEQLNEVRNYLDKHFIQINDIDLTAATSNGGSFYHDGTGWYPIGRDTASNPDGYQFTGIYNGNNHIVKGLNISIKYGSSWKKACGGLFWNNAGTIKNLGLVDGDINVHGTSNYVRVYAAAIVGMNTGIITNCYNKNCNVTALNTAYPDKSGNPYAGGIAGYNANGIVKNCYNISNVVSKGYDSSYSSGITADGNIVNCYNGGNIAAYTNENTRYANAGGIGGLNVNTIENCFNFGNISARRSSTHMIYGRPGGIIPYLYSDNIKNCYWNVDNIFWSDNYQTSAKGIGEKYKDYDGSDPTIGKTTIEMKSPEFVALLNENRGENTKWYPDIYNINDGYPIFEYQLENIKPINENGDYISIDNIDDSNTIIIPVPDFPSEDVLPIIALYEENSLLNVHTYTDYTLLDNTLTLNQVNLNVPPTTTEIKIFVWKDLQTIQPLMKCYHIQ